MSEDGAEPPADEIKWNQGGMAGAWWPPSGELSLVIQRDDCYHYSLVGVLSRRWLVIKKEVDANSTVI